MRILFFTWRNTLRRFSIVMKTIADEGHEIVIAYPRDRKQKLQGKLRRHENVRLVAYDEIGDPEYGDAISLLRQARDYAWYLTPEQGVASFNRRRALRHLVKTASEGAVTADSEWPDPVVTVGPEVARALDESFAALEDRLPPDPGVIQLIQEHRPDVVLVSPLVRQKVHQTEAVKAARVLGIPSALLVYSWDSLSNKGRIHVAPDRVFVWNEVQAREAVELHGMRPDQAVVTGAPHWDTFFSLRPSLDRAALCRSFGFDPAKPIVLYLGSTNEVCPDESRVVDAWLSALRGSTGPLRDANVLVRSHPNEQQRWEGWRPQHEGVAQSAKPRRTSQELYDQLHHAAAAVGLNTSAQLEASILGKPVFTFSAGEAAPAQSGSRHFYYLLEESGGVVTYAETLEEHVRQLERGVGGGYDPDAIRRFAELFVRPRGFDVEVGPIVAEEILALARSGSSGLRVAAG